MRYILAFSYRCFSNFPLPLDTIKNGLQHTLTPTAHVPYAYAFLASRFLMTSFFEPIQSARINRLPRVASRALLVVRKRRHFLPQMGRDRNMQATGSGCCWKTSCGRFSDSWCVWNEVKRWREAGGWVVRVGERTDGGSVFKCFRLFSRMAGFLWSYRVAREY